MTNEQKLAVIEALKLYIPSVIELKPDKHIELLEQAVAELEKEVTPPPDIESLLDESF